MIGKFFCPSCANFRPIEQKRKRPTGNRPICAGCKAAMEAATASKKKTDKAAKKDTTK